MTQPDPLNVQQAAALRKLADIVETNAGLADLLDEPLRAFGVNVTQNARTNLTMFRDVFRAASVVVDVDNASERCQVQATIGPVRVHAWASADAMNNGAAPPAYEPLASTLTSGAA